MRPEEGRTAFLVATHIRGDSQMNSIRIYPGRGGWFYEVWIAPRVVVSGWCASRERAAAASGSSGKRVVIKLVDGDVAPCGG